MRMGLRMMALMMKRTQWRINMKRRMRRRRIQSRRDTAQRVMNTRTDIRIEWMKSGRKRCAPVY